MKRGSSGAQTAVTDKRVAKGEGHGEDAVLGQEVIERLKSWCYV